MTRNLRSKNLSSSTRPKCKSAQPSAQIRPHRQKNKEFKSLELRVKNNSIQSGAPSLSRSMRGGGVLDFSATVHRGHLPRTATRIPPVKISSKEPCMLPKTLRPVLPYLKRYRWGYVAGLACVLLTNGIWILFPL